MQTIELQKIGLASRGVNILSYEPPGINDEVVRIIFGNRAKVLRDVTTQVLTGTNSGGWVLAGSEAYYQVKEIKTSLLSTQYLAMKANISLGNIEGKVVEESSRLAVLGSNLAPEIYAVSQASLIKEFLLIDRHRLPASEIVTQLENMYAIMQTIGMYLFGGTRALCNHTLQNNGRLKLIDAGTGDISGTVYP